MTRSIDMYPDSPYLSVPEGAPGEAENADLLEQPMGNGCGGIEGLYALISLDARSDSAATVGDIMRANEARREAFERQLAALERQREAQADAGFWGKIVDNLSTVAKVAGCVAAVAFAVGTCGAGTPVAVLAIAGATASCASLAQSEFGAFDGVLGEKAADEAGFWLGVGGAVMCLGAGALTLLGAGAATQATASNALATTAERGALVVGGTAGAGAGAARIAQAGHARDAAYYGADALRAKLDAQTQKLLIAQFILSLEETKDRETANLKRVLAMNNERVAGYTAAVGGVA